MPRSVTIKSLLAAFEMMKAMRSDGLEWGEDYRPLARIALADIIEGRLHEAVDAHLLRVAGQRNLPAAHPDRTRRNRAVSPAHSDLQSRFRPPGRACRSHDPRLLRAWSLHARW
jgi:hypothetical protein